MSEGVKIIISVISFIIGLAVMFGIMQWFGINVADTIMSGLGQLRELIGRLMQLR